jgi:hypothetical protein
MLFVEKICAEFENAGLHYAIVGGYAVAFHGAVRGTVDIDFVFQWNQKTLKKAEKVLIANGLVSRLPITATDVFQFRDEYVRNRNLIAWNFYNPDDLSQQVDIIISYSLDPKYVTEMKSGEVAIKVLKKSELIKMKKQSGRDQDLQDIISLERLKEPRIYS